MEVSTCQLMAIAAVVVTIFFSDKGEGKFGRVRESTGPRKTTKHVSTM
jgi:hypothetical protein